MRYFIGYMVVCSFALFFALGMLVAYAHVTPCAVTVAQAETIQAKVDTFAATLTERMAETLKGN
jgi:hypothetical protein